MKGVCMSSPYERVKKSAYIRSPSKKGVQGQSSADKGKAEDLQGESVAKKGKRRSPFKWMPKQFALKIIEDPTITYRSIQEQIKKKYLINVSVGQCKRAKQRALFDHEGGLIEHYSRLWDYRKQLLDTNPCSSVHLHVDELDNDGHKGLMESVKNLLPHAEHRQCARHIYANFKKKWNGLHFKSLFWLAATTTIQHTFYSKMNLIGNIDPEAKQWLVDRNPNSWCRAFFKMDRGCAAYENGISESYHNSIRIARGKPLIKHVTERDNVITRSGRMMTCQNCWEKGHNKKSCKKEKQPKPTVEKRAPGRKKVGSNFVFQASPSVADPSSVGPSVADSTGSGTQAATVTDPTDEILTQQSKTSDTAMIIEDVIATGRLKTTGLTRRCKSERIAKRAKAYQFGKDGARSCSEKACDV
ncbi:hypothetical protein Tco_0783913, partial [Tanacetum coccineum]